MYLNEFKNFIELEKKYSKNTVVAYMKDLVEFQSFLQSFNVFLNDKLDYLYIRKWIIKLSENGLSKRSINRKIASLKSYFKFLISIDKLKKSPLKAHKNLKIEQKIIVPFNEKELDNVFLLPHMSSATLESRIEMGEKVIINIQTFSDGHTPPDIIFNS